MFRFYIKPNSANNIKKVYFDREQDSVFFGKYSDITDINYRTIGKLRKDSWYEFSDISQSLEIYTYVDKNGEVHTWMIESGAW